MVSLQKLERKVKLLKDLEIELNIIIHMLHFTLENR